MEYITKQQAIDLVKSMEVLIGCTGVSVLTKGVEGLPFQVIVPEADFETIPVKMLPDILAAAVGWVSVKDRLPERNEKVLAIVRLPGEEEYIGENKYKGPLVGTRRKVWDIHGDYVTHWMPLPKPPKE